MWKIRMLVSKNPRILILILLDELELMAVLKIKIMKGMVKY